MRTAPFLARLAAFLIDGAIVLLCSVLTFAAALTGYRIGAGRLTFASLSCILLLSSVLSFLNYLFYFTHLTMREGMTIGKRIMGIRVVRRDGPEGIREPGFARSFVRAVVCMISTLTCFAGFFVALFFGGRTLHDMVAGTEVICSEAPGGPGVMTEEAESREET